MEAYHLSPSLLKESRSEIMRFERLSTDTTMEHVMECRDASRQTVSSGVYFYRFESAGLTDPPHAAAQVTDPNEE